MAASKAKTGNDALKMLRAWGGGKAVEVENGSGVYVKVLSSNATQTYLDQVGEWEASDDINEASLGIKGMRLLASMALCDENGDRLVDTPEDVGELLGFEQLSKVFAKASEINGLKPRDDGDMGESDESAPEDPVAKN